MNPWGNEQFPMPPNMMGQPMVQMHPHPPLLPPPMLQNMMDIPNNMGGMPPGPQIGPMLPEGMQSASQQDVQDPSVESSEVQVIEDDTPAPGTSRPSHEGGPGNRRDSRNNRDRDRDQRPRPGRPDRSRDDRSREHHDRNARPGNKRMADRADDRNRNDRPDHRIDNRPDRRRDRPERRSRFDSGDKTPDKNPGNMLPGTMMMPGTSGMMPFGMMQQPSQMEMQPMGMPHPNMSNMLNMPNMPGMMPGMMQVNPMMDQNMFMMNQQMMPMMHPPNQPIYCSSVVLLTPIPGASLPNRRERPPGCRTIFVGGLPNSVKEDVLQEIFQRFGNITDIKLHRQGVCHIRFEKQECVEASFSISGFRFKYHNQGDSEATTIFVDFALNRDDYAEFERSKRGKRDPTPPRIESLTPASLQTITEKVKSDDQFAEAAPTLVGWLERGECNKKNANAFYSLIQASNNQIRRLFNEKMVLDDEYQNMKLTMKEKFAHILLQFEQVAKILSAARHQRVSDHFSKQQRRNIEMWLKMTEEVENIKEEFETNFNEDEIEKIGKNTVPQEKYDELRAEHENLIYELEGYKNEAHLAKNEAERKFETFKAHFIAQHNLNNKQQSYPPLPPPPTPRVEAAKPMPPPPTPDDNKYIVSGPSVPPSEAKLISILTAFLMVHPLGASVDYLVSYVRSMTPNVTQATVQEILQKYDDVFRRVTSGVGASIETRWCYITFDTIKLEQHN
ncbi:ecto-NOX disulfide-thiol exchanger 2-like [Cydia strobilella]|uniref:ecto-NOX disulfide-thiol exchanger 2-like n=1 Tax=Cydia strobilella TaxID=1100964 RepID=UPI003005E076